MRTGYAGLLLHGGKAPRWLFERMVKLSRAIGEARYRLQSYYQTLPGNQGGALRSLKGGGRQSGTPFRCRPLAAVVS